jgi:hypothetical protein
MYKKAAVILLTWKRLDRLENTLSTLSNQTYKNFLLHISHSNLENKDEFINIVKKFEAVINLTYSVDSNERLCFRRYEYAKNFAQDGVEVIFLLDDDVIIYDDYLETSLAQYKSKTYSSGHAYSYIDEVPDYRRRVKHYSQSDSIGHCGAGMSMIDSSIFLNDDFFNNKMINYKFDDIWLSCFSHMSGFKLKYLESTAILEGHDDDFALHKILFNKRQYVFDLHKNTEWAPPFLKP